MARMEMSMNTIYDYSDSHFLLSLSIMLLPLHFCALRAHVQSGLGLDPVLFFSPFYKPLVLCLPRGISLLSAQSADLVRFPGWEPSAELYSLEEADRSNFNDAVDDGVNTPEHTERSRTGLGCLLPSGRRSFSSVRQA